MAQESQSARRDFSPETPISGVESGSPCPTVGEWRPARQTPLITRAFVLLVGGRPRLLHVRRRRPPRPADLRHRPDRVGRGGRRTGVRRLRADLTGVPPVRRSLLRPARPAAGDDGRCRSGRLRHGAHAARRHARGRRRRCGWCSASARRRSSSPASRCLRTSPRRSGWARRSATTRWGSTWASRSARRWVSCCSSAAASTAAWYGGALLRPGRPSCWCSSCANRRATGADDGHGRLIHRPGLPLTLGFLASLIAVSGFLAFVALHAEEIGARNTSLALFVYGGVVVGVPDRVRAAAGPGAVAGARRRHPGGDGRRPAGDRVVAARPPGCSSAPW